MLRSLLIGFAFLVSSGFLFGQSQIAPTDPLSPIDEQKALKVPEGFEVQLVAAEPDIQKPMQLAWDLRGRLWVTMSVEYPFPAVGRKGRDRVMVLSDFGADGRAKKLTTFADELNIPIGVLPLPDGKTVLVSSIDPGSGEKSDPPVCWIWRLTDTDGDGKADLREKLYGPFGVRDTHGMINSFTLMPDGWVYACHGFANDSKIRGHDRHEIAINSGNTVRFRPDGRRIEVYTRGQVNPFGMTYDRWFNLYTADCHSKPITQLIRGAVYQSFGKPHDGLGYGPDMIRHDHQSTGLCGLVWYEADHFPKEFQDSMFLGNVVTSRVNRNLIEFDGSTPRAVEKPDFVVSSDPWFRPVDLKLGTDGALYISDFYNKIIGHYEVDLKHPGRDRTRGRIWRVVHTGTKPGAVVPFPRDISKLDEEKLDPLLGDRNIVTRMAATHAMIHRSTNSEEKRIEREKREIKDQSAEYWAHFGWANEAIPLNRLAAIEKHGDLLEFAWPLTQAHQIRRRAARKEFDREFPEVRIQEKFEMKVRERQIEPMVLRAELDALTTVPDIERIDDLLDWLQTIKPNDSHLRHAAKIALRACLSIPRGWQELRGMKLSDLQIAMLREVLVGVPSKDSAWFIVEHLAELAKEPARLPSLVEHAARYGDNPRAVLAFVRKHQPKDAAVQAVLFAAYVRGIQQIPNRFDQGDREFGNLVVRNALGHADPAAIQSALDAAAVVRLTETAEAIRKFAVRRDRTESQRSAALNVVSVLQGADAVPFLVSVMNDQSEGPAVRERAAQSLGSIGNESARKSLADALVAAPGRLQTAIAAALAVRVEGSETLLQLIKSGKASPRLLQDRAVRTRVVESKVADAESRIAALTQGLPTADQRLAQLFQVRKDGYGRFKADAALGAAVFKTSCANCHQLGGQGAKVGPQLDGIGARGLDRLLEDVLDPSRNVDQAMRTTQLGLKDGRSVSGLLLREEGNILVVADNQGKEIRVSAADIDERKISQLSPMPANLVDSIKEPDFYHLMAFLLSQRVKDKAAP